MITAKDKLEALVIDMNSILSDEMLYPDGFSVGTFDLKYKDTPYELSVELYFIDNDKKHCVFSKKSMFENMDEKAINVEKELLWQRWYIKILVIAFWDIDSIGMFETDILSFSTLFKEGLKKLK